MTDTNRLAAPVESNSHSRLGAWLNYDNIDHESELSEKDRDTYLLRWKLLKLGVALGDDDDWLLDFKLNALARAEKRSRLKRRLISAFVSHAGRWVLPVAFISAGLALLSGLLCIVWPGLFLIPALGFTAIWVGDIFLFVACLWLDHYSEPADWESQRFSDYRKSQIPGPAYEFCLKFRSKPEMEVYIEQLKGERRHLIYVVFGHSRRMYLGGWDRI